MPRRGGLASGARPLPIFALILALSGGQGLWGQTTILKISSGTPENTPIGRGLNKLAGEWKRISSSRVQLKVFHGGALGDDESVRQKMNTGLLDGGLFTSQGMGVLLDDFMAFSAPSLVHSQDEFSYLLKKMGPELRTKLEDRGYVALTLAAGGWVRFFTRSPVATPDQLSQLRLAVNPYDASLQRLFKLSGMNIVAVPSTLMLQQLQARSVDAFYTSPVYFSYQWSSFSSATNNMTDLPISPFMGCLIVKKSTWEKIPAGYRQPLLDASAMVGAEIERELLTKEETIIKELADYGLNVVALKPQESERWRQAFSKALEGDGAGAFNRQTVAQIRSLLSEYRKSQGEAPKGP